MKAILVSEAMKIEVVEKEKPLINNSNEVLIKVKAAGICGSDMHIYHGTNPLATYPRIIGHEFVGEIIEIGEDVRSVDVGDRVAIEPIFFCGECYACRSGRHNVCEQLEVMGVHRDGGFQEYVVVPENKAHKFADHISWENAVLIEPFTIAAQSTSRGDVREGDVVFISGAGPIGLTILQYSIYKGAKCIVVDLDESRLKTAKELGAEYTINPSKEDVVKKVFEVTNGVGANVSIDAVCIKQTFEQAIKVTSAAGRVVVLGFTDETSDIPQLPITKSELAILGSRLQADKFPEVINLFNEGKLNSDILISHKFEFKDIDKAIKTIENEDIETRKVILTF